MIIPKNAEKKQACEDYVCSPNAHDHAHTYADGATCSHTNDHGGRAVGEYNGDKFDAKNAAVKSKIANDEEGGFASKNLTRKLAAQDACGSSNLLKYQKRRFEHVSDYLKRREQRVF